MKVKKCSKCGEEKPLNSFSKCRSMLLGLDAYCKECRAKLRKENRWDKKWDNAHPELRKKIDEKCRKKVRIDALNAYSNGEPKCQCCGEERLEFLAIDHINGDGSKHRREIKRTGGKTIFQWLRNNNYPEGFRVLCHNCNMSRGHYGYCPHEKEKQ